MIRPRRHRNLLATDVRFFAAGLVVVGGLIGAAIGELVDLAVHRHRVPR